MKIIIDAFGGDNAPLEIIKGCIEASNEYSVGIVLTGDQGKIEDCAKKNNLDISKFEIIHAGQVLTMDDEPTDVVKAKSESSMAVGCKALKAGKGDAFASAGNSGALVVGSTMIVKRIKGIKRVTFSAIMPKEKGFFMFSDAGANVDCRPEMLEQFAFMADVYMRKVMAVNNPRVGLLNVGTEEHKGTDLQRATYELLKKNKKLNFVGNVEGRDIPADGADIIISDGYSGNIAVKTYEGVAEVLMGKIKGVFGKNILTKIAALLVLSEIKQMKKELDYHEYGGAPIMGASKPVFKIHGSAKARTVKNAIARTIKYVESGVIDEISNELSAGD